MTGFGIEIPSFLVTGNSDRVFTDTNLDLRCPVGFHQ